MGDFVGVFGFDVFLVCAGYLVELRRGIIGTDFTDEHRLFYCGR